MSTPPPARCHIGAKWNDGQGADLAPQWSEQNRLSSIVSATWLRLPKVGCVIRRNAGSTPASSTSFLVSFFVFSRVLIVFLTFLFYLLY